MAGIGFELQKILKDNNLLSVVKAFGYSAVLSSGPWVISMVIILAMGLTSIYISNNVEFKNIMLQGMIIYV